MKQKSLAKNASLYTIKILASMIFPLITFRYISRVLLPQGIGRYNFSSSLVSYFFLIANLGISTYAIREGSKVRDSKKQFETFAKEMFTINLISTGISIMLLIVVVSIIPILAPYRCVILLLAIAIPMTTLGTEWVFNIYEDFVYITIRSVIFQLISLVLMFSFVRTESDVWKYALVSVFATTGSNLLNVRYSRKYIKLGFLLGGNTRRHLGPIMVLFASTIASQIYINADVTMLGMMKGDYATGIYSASSKIYNVVRMLLTAIITVLLPRISYVHKIEGSDHYSDLLDKTFHLFLCIVMPAAIGLLLISKSTILLLSGIKFVDARVSLEILCITMIFSTLGSFISNTVLIVKGKEKKILMATGIGATLNIVLNLFFIPAFSYNGAAFTTLISEIIVFLIQYHYAKQYSKIHNIMKEFIKIICGLMGMIVVRYVISLMPVGSVADLLLSVICCAIIYVIIMIVVRQETFLEYWRKMTAKIATGRK